MTLLDSSINNTNLGESETMFLYLPDSCPEVPGQGFFLLLDLGLNHHRPGRGGGRGRGRGEVGVTRGVSENEVSLVNREILLQFTAKGRKHKFVKTPFEEIPYAELQFTVR